MRRSYRAAIVGLGAQATNDHLPGFARARLARVTAVCDVDSIKLDKISSELEVPGYTSHEELLASEELDFVVVATPHNTHRTIVEHAARARVHVLKEKPFATTFEEATHILRLAEQHGIEVMTTLQRRFNPIYTSYFQLVDQIGSPFFVTAQYTMFVDAPHQGWRGSRSCAGGGCIIDMGYHLFDLIIWFLGLPSGVAASVSNQAIDGCEYDAEDTAAILLRWESGLHGSCIVSRYLPPKTERLVVVGTGGIIEVERGSIRRLDSNGEVSEHLLRERAWDAAASTQIDYFCRVLAGERENIGSPRRHLQHAALIDACYESVRRGTFVDPRAVMA